MADLQDPSDDMADDMAGAPVGDVAGEEHISFVQRLESHFGHAVDPEIDLHEGEYEGDDAKLSREPDEKESSSSSRALVRKLAESVQLGARFKIKREIARGGMGIICRVWDQDLRRNLAMKVMHSNSSVDGTLRPEDHNQEKLGRFLEEAQITGQLDHPGIVPVHDLGIDTKGRCYFTMRLVRGRELKEVLDLMRAGKENWTRTKVLSLILKVCEAMGFAHSKGVVHRDLKPQNVMVGRFGEVYVMDWGLARVLGRRDSHDIRLKPEVDEPSSLSLVRTVRKDDSEANPDSSLVTMDGDVVGTPSFMAVEQAQGKLDLVGVRSDVYSLGAILYYMLTGRSPYVTPGERASPHTVLNRVLQGPPEPVSSFAKDQPAELVAICQKAMHRDAQQRYSSMLAVAEDIQAYLEDRVVGAYEGGSLAEARKWISRNRAIAIAIAALVVLSFGSAIGFAVMQQIRVTTLEENRLAIQKSADEATTSANEADRQRAMADAAKALAEKNLVKATASEQEANRNAEQASRAGYRSNILAADFSLRLDDVKEARTQLKSSSKRFRDWEHSYLDLRTRNALVNIDALDKAELRGGSSGSSADYRGPIDQVAWNPAGDGLALLTREGWLRFMQPQAGASDQGLDLQLKHTSPLLRAAGLIPDMALAAQGARVALVGFDSLVRVFDIARREELMQLPLSGDPGHVGRVGRAAYCLADGRLMTGSDSGEVIIWGPNGSMHVLTVSRRGLAVCSLAWSPSGDHWAAGFSDGVVLVWEASLPQNWIHRLEGHVGRVSALAFSADSSQIFSAGEDGKLNVWTRGQGRLVGSYSEHDMALTSMDYDPFTGRVVTGSRDQTLRIWNVDSGEARVLLGHEAEVRAVAFSDDGRRIVSSDTEGSVKIWNAHADAAITDLEPMDAGVSVVAFGPKGNFLASADERGELLLWDAKSGLPHARLRGHTPGKSITALCFDDAGAYLFSASEDHTVRRWNLQSGRQSAVYQHGDEVEGLAISAEGKTLFTASAKSIRSFDIETREEIRSFAASKVNLTGLSLHPTQALLACTNSGELMLFDTLGSSEPQRFKLPGSQGAFRFSPDGTRLLARNHKGELFGWDLTQVEEAALALEAIAGVSAIAYHPGGRRFATGSRDGSLRIWDAGTGEVLLSLLWPEEEIQTIAFDSSGARLVCGSKSGAIRIWETDQAELRQRRGFEERERRVALQPEVERLFNQHFRLSEVISALNASASLDSSQRETGVLLAHLRGDDPSLHSAASLSLCLDAGQPSALYAQALRQAEAALKMSSAPHQPSLLLALGAAFYRTGDIEQANARLLEALARGEALKGQPLAADKPLGQSEALILTLFRALVAQRSEQPREALRLFEEASSIIQRADSASLSVALQELWNEVGEELAGS